MKYQPKSKEEAEFLKNYNPDKYPKPSVAADCVLFAYDHSAQAMKVLMIQRGGHPCKGQWCFPGGFVNMDEHIHHAVAREMEEETGVTGLYCDLYYAMGDPDRDPRDRVMSMEYIALTDFSKIKARAGDDAHRAEWFVLSSVKRKEYATADGRFLEIQPVFSGFREFAPRILFETRYGNGLTKRVDVLDDADIAFDHAKVAVYALERLRERILCSDLPYGALPAQFSGQEFRAFLRSVFFEEEKTLVLEQFPYLRKLENGNYTYLPKE